MTAKRKLREIMKHKYGTKKEQEALLMNYPILYQPIVQDLRPRKGVPLEHNHELTIYVLTIYGEARGEIPEGQQAVGEVIINRWYQQKDYFGLTIREVCLTHSNGIYQFSCWNPKDPNYMQMRNPDLSVLRQVANNTLMNYFGYKKILCDRRVCYYKHKHTPNYEFWRKLEPAFDVGHHIFYRDENLKP